MLYFAETWPSFATQLFQKSVCFREKERAHSEERLVLDRIRCDRAKAAEDFTSKPHFPCGIEKRRTERESSMTLKRCTFEARTEAELTSGQY